MLRRSLLELACAPDSARETRVYRLAGELIRRHERARECVDRARDRADLRAALWSAGGC